MRTASRSGKKLFVGGLCAAVGFGASQVVGPIFHDRGELGCSGNPLEVDLPSAGASDVIAVDYPYSDGDGRIANAIESAKGEDREEELGRAKVGQFVLVVHHDGANVRIGHGNMVVGQAFSEDKTLAQEGTTILSRQNPTDNWAYPNKDVPLTINAAYEGDELRLKCFNTSGQ
jgi:hypothetical protein